MKFPSFWRVIFLIGTVAANLDTELQIEGDYEDANSGYDYTESEEETQFEAIVNCPFNYYLPCQCKSKGTSYDIACFGIPTDTVQRIFEATPIRDHTRLYLYVNYTTLPANVIGHQRVQEINIVCQHQFKLQKIDADAFRSSEHYTTELSIGRCDLTEIKFDFLENFSVLTKIRITDGPLLTFQSMPFLPSLDFIWVSECFGFREWYYPSQTPNLRIIRLREIGAMSPSIINDILDSIVYYKHTLKELSLTQVGLTQMPPQIRYFTQLSDLIITGDAKPTLAAGSLTLTAPVQHIWIHESSINLIEPGAFQGDFSMSKIDLGDNDLTSFEEQVFYNLLKSMTTGGINIFGNPITCDCHLNWLIRDNRPLMVRVLGGVCNNKTRFADLDSEGFGDCSNEDFPATGLEGFIPLKKTDIFLQSTHADPGSSAPTGLEGFVPLKKTEVFLQSTHADPGSSAPTGLDGFVPLKKTEVFLQSTPADPGSSAIRGCATTLTLLLVIMHVLLLCMSN